MLYILSKKNKVEAEKVLQQKNVKFDRFFVKFEEF